MKAYFPMQREALLTKDAAFKAQVYKKEDGFVHHKSLIWLRLKAALGLELAFAGCIL
jgi:hypothetical protein